MPEILVTYASKHGHTGKIAARIARAAAEAGAATELRDIDGSAHVDLADYDAVVVGSSIHAGKHSREILHWARAHQAALNALPSAFFTVCLSAAEDTPESRTATAAYIDDFLQATGWTPATTATFAGALQYREYDFMTRLLMRLLMHKDGRPTDASRDYEYTDWAAVAEFGRACARLVPEPAGRPGG
jgi:menaquinone-dependent protoporphyrinogen oxidase